MTHMRFTRLLPNGVRLFVFMAFLTLSSFCSAQYFNITSTVCDSIDVGTYFFHVSGVSAFSDSLDLHAELLTNEEEPTVLFSGHVLLSDTASSTLPVFIYDEVNGLFSFDIGTFPTNNLYLHMWVVTGNGIENEFYFKQ